MKKIAVMIVASSLFVAGQAQAQADGALAQAKQATDAYSRYTAQSKGCKWGRPVLDDVIWTDLSLTRKLAAAATGQNLDATMRIPTTSAEACGGPVDNATRDRATLTYWEWLSRLSILATMVRQTDPAWVHGMMDIPTDPLVRKEAVRKTIEDRLVGAFGEAKVRENIEGMRQESIAILNLACEPRKNFDAKTPRACPAIPAGVLAQRPAAMIRLDVAERLARKLVASVLKEQRGEIGQAYRLQREPFELEASCKAGDLVIYPDAPDTVTKGEALDVSVHRNSDGGIAGRIIVQPGAGSSYRILDGAVLGLDEFTEGQASFSMCFPG